MPASTRRSSDISGGDRGGLRDCDSCGENSEELIQGLHFQYVGLACLTAGRRGGGEVSSPLSQPPRTFGVDRCHILGGCLCYRCGISDQRSTPRVIYLGTHIIIKASRHLAGYIYIGMT